MADIKVIVREIDGSEWVPASAMQSLIEENERLKHQLSGADRLIDEVVTSGTAYTERLMETLWGEAARNWITANNTFSEPK